MAEIKINKVIGKIGETPFVTKMNIGEHELTVDEPVSSGGGGKGPKSHDLLLSSLVSCTCITVKMYAMRKQWNLTEMITDAIMERNIESGIQTTGVVMNVSFKGDLTDEQKKRLVFIAGKCPVHKTLKQAMTIVINHVEH